MKRPSTLLACGFTLLFGIGLGAALNEWPFNTAVQAKALDAEEADRLYNELGQAHNALLESSRILAKIAAITTPSVVHIQSEHAGGRGRVEETGSGVIVRYERHPGTYVVTNRHVIATAKMDDISIHLFDGRVLHPTRLWSDRETDLALLRVPDVNLAPARWGDSDHVDIGHLVLAMGSPFGLSRSTTLGIISAKGRRSLKLGDGGAVLNQDFLQTDAAINPGNSGGPLIDLHGRVIGINTAIASNSGGNDGIGFSIPSNLARQVTELLLEHGRVPRSYLGVKLDPNFDIHAATRLKLDRARGAHVVQVYPSTPASLANLQMHDVILSFDGIDVFDENHLIHLVSLTPVGRKVRVILYRDGRRMAVDVTLADRTELEQRSEAPATRPGMGVSVEPMGLTLHELTTDIADQLGFDESARGLLVLNLDPASPLRRDVQLYDLIEEIARTPVATLDDLDRALLESRSSPAVLIKLRRRAQGEAQSHIVVWHRENQ